MAIDRTKRTKPRVFLTTIWSSQKLDYSQRVYEDRSFFAQLFPRREKMQIVNWNIIYSTGLHVLTSFRSVTRNLFAAIVYLVIVSIQYFLTELFGHSCIASTRLISCCANEPLYRQISSTVWRQRCGNLKNMKSCCYSGWCGRISWGFLFLCLHCR